MNENVVNLVDEELELTKKLLAAAYEREVFYREDRDKWIETAEKWKAECRYVAIACGWSRDEYEIYLKERQNGNQSNKDSFII